MNHAVCHRLTAGLNIGFGSIGTKFLNGSTPESITNNNHLDAASRHLQNALALALAGPYVLFDVCQALALKPALMNHVVHHRLTAGLNKEVRAICGHGQLDKALNALTCHMTASTLFANDENEAGFKLYIPLLKACSKGRALTHAKLVYGLLTEHNVDPAGTLGDHLVATFAKCGALDDAQQVLFLMPHRTVYSWTGLISGYVSWGQGREALKLHCYMRDEGVEPDHYTFVSLFKACALSGDLLETEKLHSDAWKKGFLVDAFVGSTLVHTYGKCGNVSEAENVFDALSVRNGVTWNAMLAAYVEQGEGRKALQLYRQMQDEGVNLDEQTFVSTLQACSIFIQKEKEIGLVTESMFPEIGQSLHAEARWRGFTSNLFVGSTLVNMYSKCGLVAEAENVFDSLLNHDIAVWNGMLSAYLEQGQVEKVHQLYKQLLKEGVNSSQQTLVIALQACSEMAKKSEIVAGEGWKADAISLAIGMALHVDAEFKNSLDVFVGSTLISMYAKSGCLLEAEKVFEGLATRNVVSWNAMLQGYVDQGLKENALRLYRQIQEEEVGLHQQSFVLALQACCIASGECEESCLREVMSLEVGRALHAHALREGLMHDPVVANMIVLMYCKCRNIAEAENVVDKLPKCSPVLWNTLIAAYLEEESGDKALQLYEQMHTEGVSPNQLASALALQACALLAGSDEAIVVEKGPLTHEKCLEIGKAVHADALRKVFTSDIVVCNSLISMYGKCGSVIDAENMFLEMSEHDTWTWNKMLSVYLEQDQAKNTLHLYRQMQEEGVHPNQRTFMIALQACGTLVEQYSAEDLLLAIGRGLHADALKSGVFLDVFIGSTLLKIYGKHSAITDAENVFVGLSKHDVVSWSAMLSVYMDCDKPKKALQLYRLMQEQGVSPDQLMFVVALQACGSLIPNDEPMVEDRQPCPAMGIGQALHADAWRKGFLSDIFVGNTLVSMYGKCGSLSRAEKVFAGLPVHDIVSWNAMLSAYVEQLQGESAIQLYRQMQEEGFCPDQLTIVLALQACTVLAGKEDVMVGEGSACCAVSSNIGQALHADALRVGLASNVLVASALVCMYGKCGKILEAEKVFDSLSECEVVLWGSLFSAYLEQGKGKEALECFRQMQVEGVSPSQQTFVMALQACGVLAVKDDAIVEVGHLNPTSVLEIGQALHSDVRSKGFTSNAFIGSALVCMYGRCGSIKEAEDVFDGLIECTIVCWNAMLSTYIEQGEGEKALQLYRKMEEGGVIFNETTVLCALEACWLSGNVEICKQLHYGIVATGYDFFPMFGRVLLRAYAGCAHMVDALAVFRGLGEHDVTSWTACIAGYAQEGNSIASLQMFKEMKQAGVRPNGVSFLSLLSVCTHAGHVDKGLELFESMVTEYALTPTLKHYIHMIDLLGRAGEFKKLQDLLLQMPMLANLAVWTRVLDACCTYGNVELGRLAFDHVVSVRPKEASAYVLMSHIYASAGDQDCADEIENLRLKAHGYG